MEMDVEGPSCTLRWSLLPEQYGDWRPSGRHPQLPLLLEPTNKDPMPWFMRIDDLDGFMPILRQTMPAPRDYQRPSSLW